jgi:hypothetical protein
MIPRVMMMMMMLLVGIGTHHSLEVAKCQWGQHALAAIAVPSTDLCRLNRL